MKLKGTSVTSRTLAQQGLIQTRDGKLWDRCRSCGQKWNVVTHSSKAQCRGCGSQKKPFDPTILPSIYVFFDTLSQDLQGLALHQETLQQKGYDIKDLSHGSVKKIIHKCNVCEQPKETPFKLFVQGKNLSHVKCKSVKTKATNLANHGVTNTYNIPAKVQQRQKAKDDEIQKSFKAKGYQVLSIDRNVKPDHIVVRFLCPHPNYHKHQITWKDWNTGKQRCGICFGNQVKITFDIVKESFELEGYQLLATTYVDNNTRLAYICPNSHKNETSWKIWERGHRCPCSKCNKSGTSKAEEEVRSLFSAYNPKKDRTIIYPKELDIYFPDHKVAVEYCGLYWHSADIQDRISVAYHHNKRRACVDKDVRLITLFEDEWLQHKEICISRIKNALGASSRRIFARQCKVREVDKDKARSFFVYNHLQGYGGAEKIFGLYYNEELVYAVSLRKPIRSHVTDKKTIEIKRMAPTLDTMVVGGASRLFKRVKEYARQRGYEQILSYCDKRWGTGKVYQQLGMTMIRESNYTPSLTNGRRRVSIQTYAGKEIPKGLYKIYDCGHQTWTYDV